jgi:6-phosphogluconolactonase
MRVFRDSAELAAACATLFAQMARRCVSENGEFTVALSGGTTPREIHRRIAAGDQAESERLPWDKIHVFFGDERCVPPDSPESNFRMAQETLFSQVPIPPANIHRMKGELEPGSAAAEYEAELRRKFKLGSQGLPRFDLLLLGVGPDGHTASLFPGTAALTEQQRLAVANYVPHLDAWRLTLTFPVLNHAACVLFLTTGEEKAPVVRAVFRPSPGAAMCPARLVQPKSGWLRWFLDEAAASQMA